MLQPNAISHFKEHCKTHDSSTDHSCNSIASVQELHVCKVKLYLPTLTPCSELEIREFVSRVVLTETRSASAVLKDIMFD